MPWKAWLEGNDFDLETLGGLFPKGEPLVGQDPAAGCYLESSALQDANGQIDTNTAQALLKRINGAARAIEHGFQPVSLTGRYTAPDGTTSVVIGAAALVVRSKMKATATVLKNGTPVPEPPPRGPRYMKLAEQEPDVADAL
ncbi:MAG TPA: hypothetical protein VK280_25975, partial [Streptosporangiaceae bacterium]|nr:hypothetical protein [Streptosporangiaceae bacterium]